MRDGLRKMEYMTLLERDERNIEKGIGIGEEMFVRLILYYIGGNSSTLKNRWVYWLYPKLWLAHYFAFILGIWYAENNLLIAAIQNLEGLCSRIWQDLYLKSAISGCL